jgi:hypothetical protein
VKAKPTIYSAVILVVSAWVCRHLITGGWLSNHYELNDPTIVNLGLAIFEPIAVLGVIAYWVWRTSFLSRLLFVLFVIQLLIAAGFLTFVGFFFLTWKPRMM